MLGALYAAVGALTFSLNNVAVRRGVVTGSVLQAMALTVPIGGLSFLVMALCVGELHQILVFPAVSLAWLVGQGVVHFVFGRYCNYRSNQLMGVNLSGPVVQLQVPVSMVLAVVTLHERFTVLQAIGSVLMLAGSFATRSGSTRPGRKVPASKASVVENKKIAGKAPGRPVFVPSIVSGSVFGCGAALCYGASPLMAREAFLYAPGTGTLAAGCLAYGAATLFFALILLKPGSITDIRAMKRENLPWFLASAILVAVSQACVYASLAIAPLMVVTPILQLALVFRLFLSYWINPGQEVLNTAVVVAAAVAVVGSILVALNTDDLAAMVNLPDAVGSFLRYRLAGN